MPEPVVTFAMPPQRTNAAGQIRRVGFEMEFAGVGLEGAATAIEQLFGGQRQQPQPFVCRVVDTMVGDFDLELDAALLKERGYAAALKKLGIELDDAGLGDKIEKAIGSIAATLVPYEVVTPPLPLTQLEAAERLRQALHELGAQGTHASALHAFGCHINPEAAALEAGDVLAHMRAFLVLYERLRQEGQVDLSRRLTPFIDPFPLAYRQLVLDPDYAPDIEDLAADYVKHNPTRNRPLDLLPLLVHICGPEAVAGAVEGKAVGARPAYHYRMPDCAIGDPHWRIAAAWNRWVEVERLAVDETRLKTMGTALWAEERD